MKKNVMMRVASLLLVAVLASTCGISGTFAKYVTSGSSSDTARVAKWGVIIEHDNSIFEEDYKDSATTVEAEMTVVSSVDGEDLVAPGTNGILADFSISGTPEVDVKVTYSANVTLTGWEVENVAKYCPLKITVNGTIYQIDVGTDAAELEAAVEAAIGNYTNTYQANTDLAEVGDDLKVSWEWPFESGHDDADTALGNQAAAGNAATITIEVTCTIEQID